MVFIFVHHSRSKFRKAFNAFFFLFVSLPKIEHRENFGVGWVRFLENDVLDFSVMEEKFHLSILLGLESFSFFELDFSSARGSGKIFIWIRRSENWIEKISCLSFRD
jgi:hypothetical protein